MFFVFDIETVNDFDFIRTVLEDPDEDEETMMLQAAEQLSRGGSGFMPPMYHRMISWVGLWIENNGMPKQKVSWSGEEEKEGLRSLFDALGTYKDFGLIHHNGRSFDLPVLLYRAMKHGLQMPARLSHYDIQYRYSNDNVDLMDEFSNYGASSWPKLKHLGRLIGIPFKKTGEGGDVLRMYRDGELEQIERYCYEDVMGTYIVWLHLRFTTGAIDRELFENLKERALNKLSDIQNS